MAIRGRPRKYTEDRYFTPRHVKLRPDADDAICRIAIRRGLTVHATIRLAVDLLIVREERRTNFGSHAIPPA